MSKRGDKKRNKVKNIKALLKSYNPKKIRRIRKLKFEGVKHLNVYNISAPFKLKRKNYLLGRVELRDFELGSLTIFFYKEKEKQITWKKCDDKPYFNLQDPFRIKIDKQIIIGGVEVMTKSAEKGIDYRTVFYKGETIEKLKRFATGPWGMKDIRFIKLKNKKIGVFTRPQGSKAGKGKIGFLTINSLNKLKPRIISNAKIIKNMFARGEWGGVNEIHILKNGKMGILGHIAKFSRDKKKYYYPVSFYFDTKTEKFYGMKILLTRQDIPNGKAERADLYNVLYPGGIIRNKKNNRARLFVGVSDSESYVATIEDPFKEYEKLKCHS